MNLLYVTMSRRETAAGLLLLAVYLLMPVIPDSALLFFSFCCLTFIAALVIFRKFLKESCQVPHVTPAQILLKALLGIIVSQLCVLLTNDLLYFFIPSFYIYTDTGPRFYNVTCEIIAAMAQEHFLLTAAAVIVLMPVVDELLYRGLLFGKLLPKSPVPALLVSTALFILVRIAGLFGNFSISYILVSCLQYVPMCLLLSWVYTRSETILTPILAHMVINAVSFFTMR